MPTDIQVSNLGRTGLLTLLSSALKPAASSRGQGLHMHQTRSLTGRGQELQATPTALRMHVKDEYETLKEVTNGQKATVKMEPGL